MVNTPINFVPKVTDIQVRHSKIRVIEYKSVARSHAEYIRNFVANAQVMYSESYTEYDEADIYDMLESVSLDEDLIGMECPLLDSVEFSSAMGRDE